MKFNWNRHVILLLLIFAVCGVGVSAAQTTTMVEIRPSNGAYLLGNHIQVDVWVTNVENLYGTDVQLRFDSNKLTVVDNVIMPQSEFLNPQIIVKKDVEEMNGVGTIWYAATQLFPTMPVSGSGVLFTFTFEVLEEGVTAVTIKDQVLATIDGEVIPAEVVDAIYLLSQDAAYRIFLPSIVEAP